MKSYTKCVQQLDECLRLHVPELYSFLVKPRISSCVVGLIDDSWLCLLSLSRTLMT